MSDTTVSEETGEGDPKLSYDSTRIAAEHVPAISEAGAFRKASVVAAADGLGSFAAADEDTSNIAEHTRANRSRRGMAAHFPPDLGLYWG